MYVTLLVLFTIVWIATVYGLNCLIARRWIHLDPKTVAFYVATMAGIGVSGEILVDTAYYWVVGQPLWEYHLLPIHSAYTSVYSLLLWGAVGFHIYLFHGILRERGITSLNALALAFGLEAIFYEAVVNLSFLAILGEYIYYYLPNDLWHITSIQAFPFYLLAGYLTVCILRFAIRFKALSTAGGLIWALSLVAVGWFIAG